MRFTIRTYNNISLPNFLKVFILILIIFTATCLYLHQKVLLFIEAYELNDNYTHLNQLVDKKDYLMYNLAKETALAKINQWTENNGFALAKREKVIALDLRKENPSLRRNSLAFLFNRVLGIPANLPKAVAGEKE